MSPAGSRLLGGLVAAILVAGTAAVVWNGRPREQPAAFPLTPSFEYKLNGREARSACVPRAGFAAAGEIETGLASVEALAASPEGWLAAAGAGSVAVVDGGGQRRANWQVSGSVRALAVTSNRVWAGVGGQVVWWTLDGAAGGQWAALASNAVITSLAVADRRLYIADAGTRLVYACDLEGTVQQTIGRRDPARGIDGFLIPSPHFDLLLAPDGLLRVVNPGRHRVEAYTLDGDLEMSWGKPSLAVDGFCGCCNPAHLAMLPDGRYVTSEKGLRRVKVYDARGEFVGVVPGAEDLGPGAEPAAIAVDGRGRILIAPPGRGKVRIYERKD